MRSAHLSAGLAETARRSGPGADAQRPAPLRRLISLTLRAATSAALLPASDSPHRPTAMPPDIRWQQRFANFCLALDQLETFFEPPALNERERQGLIKAFEYCFELGWNTLRDLLLTEGNAGLIGSRDTLRLAFRMGLIDDGEGWLAMVQDRNLTSHTYNRSTAEQVSEQVAARYLPCFRELRLVLSERVRIAAAEEGDG